ncbi:MAG: glycine zipper 2TM domain-containing protein [Paracoccaceae bacterium]
MKRLVLALPLMLAAAACTTTEKTTVGGAATGAVLGAAVSGSHDKGKGAILGGLAGAAVGNMIGQAQDGKNCRYRDAYGREYIAACPR